MPLFMVWVMVIVLVAFIGWVIYGYASIRGIEEEAYVLKEHKGDYEVRRYDPSIVASVDVSGPYRKAVSDGFRTIASYIFGNNTAHAVMAPEAPKEREYPPKKILMTVPVLESGDATKHTISFVMPRTYSLETLPRPKDARIQIRARSARTVAALRFRGTPDPQTVARKKQELLSCLKRDGLTPKSQPEVAFYNSPWTPPFMRRNEILIEI